VHDKQNGGYAVLSNVISERDAATMLKMQPAKDDEWGGLFGTKLFCGKKRDYEESCKTSKRGVAEMDMKKRAVGVVLASIRAVLVVFGLLNESHFEDAASLLLSLPGAPKQNHHHDFADWLPGGHLFKQPRNADGTLPYALSVLIALEDGASWVVWKKGEKEKKKKIPRLGAVVFRGDLRHAGDAYHARNVRFHIYYGVKGEKGEVILAAPRDKEGAVSVVHAGT
jgi:hypothetical protein